MGNWKGKVEAGRSVRAAEGPEEKTISDLVQDYGNRDEEKDSRLTWETDLTGVWMYSIGKRRRGIKGRTKRAPRTSGSGQLGGCRYQHRNQSPGAVNGQRGSGSASNT